MLAGQVLVRVEGLAPSPAAVAEVDRADTLGDPDGGPVELLVALADPDQAKATHALVTNLAWGHDPLLASLGCIAVARQPGKISETDAKVATRLARESRHTQVRHACALADNGFRWITNDSLAE